MELAKAYVQIIPSAKGIGNGISQSIGDEADNAGAQAGKSIASKIKNAIIAAGIGKALTSIISSAITEGGALEQSIGGIETMYKESAERMKQYASEAYKSAGISANAYMEQATSFGATLLQSLGGNTEAAADYANRAIIDMSDNANKMGTDMEMIQNAYQGFAKQNYTMLDNLKLGYGGTKEEMQRLIRDASMMKDVQDKLNISVNEGDLSFGNIINAISVMQENLDITGTTALEASSTIEGSFNSMKAAAQNFLGNLALGEDIKPSLAALIETTGTYLGKNLFPAIVNVISALPSTLGSIASIGWDLGMDLLNGLSEGFSGNVTAFIDNIFPMLVQFSDTIREKAGLLVDVGLNLLMQLAQGIADGLPTLIETIPQIVTNIANIINENMPKILQTGWDILITLGNGLIDAIPTLIANIPQIMEAIFATWNAINWWDLGRTLISGIWNGIRNLSSMLVDGVKAIFNSLKDNVVNIFKGISSNALNIWNGIKSSISGVVNGIKSIVLGIWDSIKSVTSSVWNGILNAIKSPLNTAKNFVKGIIDTIKGFFNFKISWPKIPLPHFSIRPSGWGIGDLLKGKIPSLGIDWYAKAMDDPMMLDGATIFGMQNGRLLGGGEKGHEYITGEAGLSRIVSDVINNSLDVLMNKQMTMLEIIIEILKLILEKDPNIVIDGTPLKRSVSEYTIERMSKEIAKIMRQKGVLLNG